MLDFGLCKCLPVEFDDFHSTNSTIGIEINIVVVLPGVKVKGKIIVVISGFARLTVLHSEVLAALFERPTNLSVSRDRREG